MKRTHTDSESKYIRKLIENYVFAETKQEQLFWSKVLQKIDFF